MCEGKVLKACGISRFVNVNSRCACNGTNWLGLPLIKRISFGISIGTVERILFYWSRMLGYKIRGMSFASNMYALHRPPVGFLGRCEEGDGEWFFGDFAGKESVNLEEDSAIRKVGF